MNYAEIQEAAYGYANRTDADSLSKFDIFLRFVEAKASTILQTSKMSCQVAISVDPLLPSYGLPDDFLGMRDIRIVNSEGTNFGKSNTCVFANPSQIRELANSNAIDQDIVYYSIIADRLEIFPKQLKGTLEIVYYRNITPLTPTNNNWLADEHPNCYTYGVLTELSAYVKDAQAAQLWDLRFREALEDIKENDAAIRWGSGNTPYMRID